MGMFSGRPKASPLPRSVVQAIDPNNTIQAATAAKQRRSALTSLMGSSDTGTLASATLLGA